MNSLMLDTPKTGPVTREQACNPALVPQATRTYQPLPNKVLFDLIYDIAEESNITLSNEHLGMVQHGKQTFGVCDIEGKDFFGGHIQMMIGFCNSYNGSMATRFCIGGKVFVCSNRAFHAYTDEKTNIAKVVVRPHWNYGTEGQACDNHQGLITQIREAFQKIDEFREAQESFYGQLVDRKVNKNKAANVILKAATEGVINRTAPLGVYEEWERQAVKPKEDEYEWHEEFKDRNAYSLFNAFTQVEKKRFENNPLVSSLESMDLSGFFAKEFCLN